MLQPAGKIGKNLQGKTIAVYGASSNIGKKFIEVAARRGATIIAVARDTAKVQSISKKTANGSVEVVQADITRKKDVRKALLGRNVEITVNFAADFSADSSKAKEVNVCGEQHILDASIEFGVKRHIYISTIATQIPKSNPYSNTKLKAEEIVKATEKKKLEWVILRYAHVLGSKTWDKPFKIIFPYLQVGIPKVPTDAKNAVFPYLTIETAIEATIAAVKAPKNQLITVFDGKITIGKYLSTMEQIYHVRKSFLPNWLLQFIAKYFGGYFPPISGMSAAVEFLAYPPKFENGTMKRELKIRTRSFPVWIKAHFPQET